MVISIGLLLPFNFDAVLIALPFYCLGNLLVTNFSHATIAQTVNKHKVANTILWVISTILLYILTTNFGVCSMGSCSYQCNGFIFMVRALVGITAMISFSLILSNLLNAPWSSCLNWFKNSWIWLGKYSLDVMSLHIPVKGIVIMLFATVLPMSSDAISSNFSISLVVLGITLLVIVPIILVLNRILKR